MTTSDPTGRPTHGAAHWYDQYWNEGISGWSPSAELSAAMRDQLIRVCGDRSVLDYGGGDGKRYGDVLRRCACEYVVADVSPQVLARREAMGDRVIQADGLSRLGRHFDVIVALEVLEHLLDPVGALNAVLERLRPGGVALLSVPNAFSWWNRLRMLVGRLPASGVGPPGVRGHTYDAPHIRFFDPASMMRLVEVVGLHCEELVTDSLDLWRLTSLVPDRLWTVTPRNSMLATTLIAECRKP